MKPSLRESLQVLAALAAVALIASSCGIADWDGSNAAARAQAQAAVSQNQLQQKLADTRQAVEEAREHTEQVLAIENAHTERVLAILAFFKGSDKSQSGPVGTDHNGGLTAGAQIGFGIGWPFLLVGGGLLLGAGLLYLRRNGWL